MGHQCCSKQKVKRGLWSPEEDEKLIKFITTHGHSSWSSVPKLAGLQRCGKSCRLRWINYLRPDLKRGSFSAQEERIIVDIHRMLGNRWAQIAKHLPGRTDNEVKNFWNSCIKKKLLAQGLDPNTHKLLSLNHNNNAKPHHFNPCNLISDNSYQKPISLFTITSSKHRDFSMDMKNTPPFKPFSPPLLPQHFSSFQNPNMQSSVVFSSQESYSMASVIPSTSYPSGFGVVEDNYWWNEPIANQPLSRHEGILQVQEIQKTKEFTCGNSNMDASFDQYTNFDFDYLESALMPDGMHCGSSPIDQLTWNSQCLL